MLKVVEKDYEVEFHLNGKLVGRIIGNAYVTRRKKEHYFRKFNGFGISKVILEKLHELGVYTVIIIYTNEDGSEVLLRSDLYQWLFNGIEWVDTSDGFEDLQLVLPVIEMDVEGATPDFWSGGSN